MVRTSSADDVAPPWNKRINLAIWRGTVKGTLVFVRRFYPAWKLKDSPRQTMVQIGKKNSKLIDAASKTTPWKTILRHKYVFAIAGNTYASLFKHAARAGALVLRQEELQYEWFEYFFEPWKHYVPVKFDLSDAVAQVKWAREHDAEAKQIAEQARERARKLFSIPYMACYTYAGLRAYESMLDFRVTELPPESKKFAAACKKRIGAYCEPIEVTF